LVENTRWGLFLSLCDMDIRLEVKRHMLKLAFTHAKTNKEGDPYKPYIPIIYKSFFTYESNVGFLNIIHAAEIIKQNYLKVLFILCRSRVI